MRTRAVFLLTLATGFALAACGLEQLNKGGGSGAGGDGGTPSARDAAADAPSVVGQGCGVEQQTGITLCAATSMCPTVVVDTQAFPSCGFRIRGATVDLVCGCGEQICPMGVFATCSDATKLLSNQTQQAVCVQVSEGRCTDPTPSSSTSSSSSSSSGGSSACDKSCLQECGGGAACAQLCGCQ